MKFLSVCSGIEAASVAWEPLGWSPVLYSEIEKFPCAVLADRQRAIDARRSGASENGVPLWGDFTAIRARHFDRLGITLPDLLVGGTPCQAFSVAGLRRSLDDARGNLTLSFVRLANAIDNARKQRKEQPIVVVWENVPGVLSTKDNAFGCFLGALAGSDGPLLPGKRGKWSNAGMVNGPRRSIAWRILDAQHFGVPQRRRRVFVVASARKLFDPGAVLFELEGLRGDTPKSRQKGADVTGTLGARASSGGGFSTDFECDGGLQVVKALTANGIGTCGAEDNQAQAGHIVTAHRGDPAAFRMVAFGEYADDGTASTLKMRDYKDATDLVVAHTLRGEGFDASEDGTGRGAPLIPVCFAENSRAEIRLEGGDGSRTGALTTGGGKAGLGGPCVAFSCKDYGNDVGELSPTLRAMGGNTPNGGGQVAVFFMAGQGAKAGSVAASETTCPTLRAGDSGNNRTPSLAQGSAVRRLTPRECERLQGFTTVINRVIFTICLDHQKNSVHVEMKCLRSQSSVLPVDESAKNALAQSADVHFWNDRESQEALVALHVRQSHEPKVQAVRNQGKLTLSASGAGQQNLSHPYMQIENIAVALALISQGLEVLTTTGKVASVPISNSFIPQRNGNRRAVMFGLESEGTAKDAETIAGEAMKYIMSNPGPNTLASDLSETTWLCSALNAISLFIPKETCLENSFKFVLDVETDYTSIPWKGKPREQCPDGPRYKALGNSMAVPVMRWIGERIDAVINSGRK